MQKAIVLMVTLFMMQHLSSTAQTIKLTPKQANQYFNKVVDSVSLYDLKYCFSLGSHKRKICDKTPKYGEKRVKKLRQVILKLNTLYAEGTTDYNVVKKMFSGSKKPKKYRQGVQGYFYDVYPNGDTLYTHDLSYYYLAFTVQSNRIKNIYLFVDTPELMCCPINKGEEEGENFYAGGSVYNYLFLNQLKEDVFIPVNRHSWGDDKLTFEWSFE